MASVYKRKNEDGTVCWRAVVRIKGHPSVCNHFERKQEADDWAADVERQIRLGQYRFDRHNVTNTFSNLADRFLRDGALEHHRSAKDTLRHIAYWKTRLGVFALVHVSAEIVGQERQFLLDTPRPKGTKRASATVNRYLATLSALFSYASQQLRWVKESPCANLMKLKENLGRDRVLSDDEISHLLSSCRQSRSPYLYCIVLIALTTGARQGEILNLEWRNIDFDNKLACLRETKNGRPRSISLADPVIEELRTLYASRNLAKPLVFASKTAFGRVDIKKAWREALKRAGIDNC
jgi:integrase